MVLQELQSAFLVSGLMGQPWVYSWSSRPIKENNHTPNLVFLSALCLCDLKPYELSVSAVSWSDHILSTLDYLAPQFTSGRIVSLDWSNPANDWPRSISVGAGDCSCWSTAWSIWSLGCILQLSGWPKFGLDHTHEISYFCGSCYSPWFLEKLREMKRETRHLQECWYSTKDKLGLEPLLRPILWQ